jgi:hypothetical protein
MVFLQLGWAGGANAPDRGASETLALETHALETLQITLENLE